MPDTLASMKSMFFDRKAVDDAVDKATKKLLSRFGAFVRTRDKTSIKYGKGSAAAGAPPIAHRTQTTKKTNKKTGAVKVQKSSPLRDLIFFGYDPARKSVVIGPTLAKSGAARTIEEGGAGHAPHPHTGPAFRTELKKIGNDLRNCIK